MKVIRVGVVVLISLVVLLVVISTVTTAGPPYDLAKVWQAAGAALASCLAGFALWVGYANKDISEGTAAVAAWNIAQSRLGTLYDMAINDAELREVLNEPESWGRPPPRSLKQLQWTTNVLIALEQATVAASRMDIASRTVWCRYVENRAKVPTFRALMLASEVRDGRDNESEWRSDRRVVALVMRALAHFDRNVRTRLSEMDDTIIVGESKKTTKKATILEGDIYDPDWQPRSKRDYVELLNRAHDELGFKAPACNAGPTPATDTGPTPATDAGPTPATDAGPTPATDAGPTPATDAVPTAFTQGSDTGETLIAKLLTIGDTSQESSLRALYAEYGEQLLPLPQAWTDIVAGGHRYVVLLNDALVATFRVYECFDQGTLGLVVQEPHRRQGIGTFIASCAIKVAEARGWNFVYADVYESNKETRAMMSMVGLRKFDWYGAPLVEVKRKVNKLLTEKSMRNTST